MPVVIDNSGSAQLLNSSGAILHSLDINSGYAPLYLPDNRIIILTGDYDTQKITINIFDEALTPVTAVKAPYGPSGNAVAHIQPAPHCAFLFLRIDNRLEKYNGQTYALLDEVDIPAQTNAILSADNYNIYSLLAVDESFLYLRANNPARIAVYDYDLTLVNQIQLSQAAPGRFDADTSFLSEINLFKPGKLFCAATDTNGVYQPFIIDPQTEAITYPSVFDEETAGGPARGFATNYRNRTSIFTTPAPYNVALVNNGLNEIEIAWAYDQTAGITGFDVYVNGQKYNANALGLQSANGYTITGLQQGADYNINVIAIDGQNGSNFSPLLPVQTQTLEPPIGVSVVPGNAENTLAISWNDNAAPYIAGYNIYVDGVKNNANPIDDLAFTAENVDTTQQHDITVTTVAISGVESDPSDPVAFFPPFGESFESYALGTIPDGFTKPSDAADTWLVSNEQALSGVQSLRSPDDVGLYNPGAIEYTKNLAVESKVRFQYFSNAGYYYEFYVYIDGTQQVYNYGNTAWTLFEMVLPAGDHTFRFEVTTQYGSSGSFFIDNFGFEAT